MPYLDIPPVASERGPSLRLGFGGNVTKQTAIKEINASLDHDAAVVSASADNISSDADYDSLASWEQHSTRINWRLD
jgi:hypothetical protein